MKEAAYYSFMGRKYKSDTDFLTRYDFAVIEPDLSCHKKFNSNCGYEDVHHPIMAAFTHWSWHVSGHRLMVCDLQGVKRRGTYLLTDPAIHSVEREFGFKDLGITGMEVVLAGHTCNEICRALGLLKPNRITDISSQSNSITSIQLGRKITKYNMELTREEKFRNLEKKSNYFDFGPTLEEVNVSESSGEINN